MTNFGAQDASGASFLVVTMFSARAQIFTQKMQQQKLSKITKNHFPPGI